MVSAKVYHASEIDFTIDEVADRIEPRKVLMSSPDYFDIVDVKNVHMEGNAGSTNKTEANAQWEALRQTYLGLKERGMLDEVLVIPGAEGLEDMVFTANQSFPWVKDGEDVVIMSQMRHDSRKKEVPFFREYYKNLGYKTLELTRTDLFEGMGDTIPHYGKQLLYGGYGHRSKESAYEELAEMLNVPVVTLELVDDRFYHLDTCFIPVDTDTVFLCKEAFSEAGLAAIQKLFKKVVYIPIEEAEGNFALNAHCINDQKTGQKVATLQKGTTVMKQELEKAGYEVVELDTSEYMRSGGSVFCMKMMVY